MTITPINFNIKPTNNVRANTTAISSFICPEYKSELPKISPEYLKAPHNIVRSDYCYKPVASTKADFEPVGHYDDLDKFTELFTRKINSQLFVPNENDIKSLINRIKIKTKADEKTIREVLYNLGSFCQYDSMKIFEKFVKDNNVMSFGLPYKYFDNDTFDFSSNSAMEYLAKSKHFIEFPENGNSPKKICYILDDISLSQLENYKNSSSDKEREIYNKFKEDVKRDKYVFVLLKGWNIKTKENGYKSANFLTGSGYLENLAVEVIKRMQNGENPEKIYYSDFEDRLNNLLGGDEAKYHAVISELNPQTKNNITNEDILNILSPESISKDYVKVVLESYLSVKNTAHDNLKAQIALLKYLDEMTQAYSIDSLAIALKKMGKNIESMLKVQGYDKSNTTYIIPKSNKSHSIITNMYANLNGINPENINSHFNISDKNLRKAKVILDDLSASGTSEGQNCLDVRINHSLGKAPIIYAPVVLCNQAEDYTSRPSASCPNGYCFDRYLFDMSKTIKLAYSISNPVLKISTDSMEKELKELSKNYKLLNYEDNFILEDILFAGYDANALSVVFPYMIPDNASDIAGLILRNALAVKNDSTNKALAILYSHRGNYKEHYEDILKIIRLINANYFNKKD